jgi:hypothetical protein
MKVFVSSTSRDLAEHRVAAIRSLRRLGHHVVAMEEFTATAAYPLDRVLELVRGADAFVLIVAWRYGFIPDQSRAINLPAVDAPDDKSITEWEYLAAAENPAKPLLVFLLAETAPWPPEDMDGFGSNVVTGGSADRIRGFRARLMRDHIVSFFTTPEELEPSVATAMAAARLTRQVEINRIGPGNPIQGWRVVPESDSAGDIVDVVREASSDRVVTIDIDTEWWSTRLYLLAFLLERLTDVQRILIVHCGRFVGLLSPTVIRVTIATLHSELRRFETNLRAYKSRPDTSAEVAALIDLYQAAFGPSRPNPRSRSRATRSRRQPAEQDIVVHEREIQIPVIRSNLARWFPELLMTNPLSVARVSPASPLDLVRIFDFPGDFVPVIVGQGGNSSEQSRCHVIDKAALSLQLARIYVTDLLDEAQG